MTLQEMRDARATAWEAAKAINERAKNGEDLSAEDERAYDAAVAEVDSYTAKIEREEKHAALQSRLEETPAPLNIDVRGGDAPAGDAEARAKVYEGVFNKWAKRGTAGMSADEVATLNAGFRDFGSDPEMRALAEGTGAAGGFTVPPGFLQRLIERQQLVTSVLGVVNVIDTDSGNNLQWPTTDLTGQEGELIGENTAVTELDQTFGTATLGAYLYSSKMTRVPYVLLQDSAFDLNGWLPDKLAERLGRIHNRHFTLGTGTGQPQGLTNVAVSTTAPTGNTVTIPFDSLIDLEHSIDPLYRDNGRFMFHDSALKALRKVKDTTGQYLWQPGLTAGAPNTIHNFPYTINQHMPVPAANAKTVIFGDFRAGYIVRRVRDFTLLRLTERYAEFLQVAFLGFDRMDGKLDDLNALAQFQQSAT